MKEVLTLKELATILECNPIFLRHFLQIIYCDKVFGEYKIRQEKARIIIKRIHALRKLFTGKDDRREWYKKNREILIKKAKEYYYRKKREDILRILNRK